MPLIMGQILCSDEAPFAIWRRFQLPCDLAHVVERRKPLVIVLIAFEGFEGEWTAHVRTLNQRILEAAALNKRRVAA